MYAQPPARWGMQLRAHATYWIARHRWPAVHSHHNAGPLFSRPESGPLQFECLSVCESWRPRRAGRACNPSAVGRAPLIQSTRLNLSIKYTAVLRTESIRHRRDESTRLSAPARPAETRTRRFGSRPARGTRRRSRTGSHCRGCFGFRCRGSDCRAARHRQLGSRLAIRYVPRSNIVLERGGCTDDRNVRTSCTSSKCNGDTSERIHPHA